VLARRKNFIAHVTGILLLDVSSGPHDIAGHLDNKDVVHGVKRNALL
jgi:hypothetical protein